MGIGNNRFLFFCCLSILVRFIGASKMSYNFGPRLLVSRSPGFLAMRRMGLVIPGMYWRHSGRLKTSASLSWLGVWLFSSFSLIAVALSIHVVKGSM